MAIAIQRSEDEKELRLKIIGRLELADHADFRAAYIETDPDEVSCIVDMEEATFIDSSTIGALLTMRNSLGGEKAGITLANCSPHIIKLLEATNILRLFVIR